MKRKLKRVTLISNVKGINKTFHTYSETVGDLRKIISDIIIIPDIHDYGFFEPYNKQLYWGANEYLPESKPYKEVLPNIYDNIDIILYLVMPITYDKCIKENSFNNLNKYIIEDEKQKYNNIIINNIQRLKKKDCYNPLLPKSTDLEKFLLTKSVQK